MGERVVQTGDEVFVRKGCGRRAPLIRGRVTEVSKGSVLQIVDIDCDDGEHRIRTPSNLVNPRLIQKAVLRIGYYVHRVRRGLY